MASIKNMTLDELYSKAREVGKATPSVFARIASMEDFSKIVPRYCETICRLPCEKSFNDQLLDLQEADVVILFPEKSRDGQYKPGYAEDKVYQAITAHLMNQADPSLTYKIVYTLRCRPGKTTKKITASVAKPCFKYAEQEILSAKPKVIIATSTECIKALGMKRESVKKNLSEILEWNGIPLVVTLNPRVTTMIRQNSSGAFWGDDFLELIRRDFNKAVGIAKGVISRMPAKASVLRLKSETRLVLCHTIAQVEDVCNRLVVLPAHKIISWDTETTGLDPWAPDARFLCHQFGVRGDDGLSYAFTIPLWHRDNAFYDPDEAWTHVRRVLEADVTKVGHNGKFDLKYTQVTTGVVVKGYVFDTMYASHSICSGLQGTYGLKKAVWDWIPESGLGGYEDLMFEQLPEEEEEDGD